ncbi:MAG: efflux RND transporter permease subunit [Acidobacteria bacterium]|nr:efflux RND transporter permease subunit [Acidobacteriota bacterium]
MQKLAQICIRRPVFATMLVLALVVMGLNAYFKLGVDYFPKVEFPTVTINTVLRGAAPEEVESQVSKRIEEAVNTISGIDDLRSISAEGVSLVVVQFVLEKDPETAAQEVRDKVSAILSQLPRDVDPPVIEKLSTDAAPVVNVVVAGARDLRETTKIVDDQIKKNIESLTGVGQVRFVGDRKRQIQVWLDGEKLYSYNLNVDLVRAALAAQNVEVPGGRVDQGRRELSLRTLGRVERPRDFERIIVANVGGTPVRVKDIGEVVDGVEEPRSLARLDGKPAVVLEVRKQAGTNTLEVIQAVKARIAELQKGLPPDFEITYTRDTSRFIEESFKAVQEHLVLGGFLAALVVLFFIRSWRSTLIAAVAIPTSIISTYTLMHAMGFTLNQITMLALTLVVGIVIDDAIVVLENIFRFMEEKHLSPFEAAVQGTKDIGLAVLAATLSLIIIFLPVAMMTGIVGKFMSSFGYTAAFAIGVSLVVSFTLTPMLCSRFLNAGGGGATKDTWLFRMLANQYRVMLEWSMRHRWVVAALALAVALSSVPLFLMVGKDFLPTDDQSEFEVTVRMPPGSALEGTDAQMKLLEAELRRLPGLRNLLTTVGADTRKQVDRGSILVELVPENQRQQSQKELMLMARERLAGFRDMTIGVQLPSLIQGSGTNSDLQFFLQGPDLNRLDQYAGEIKRRLAQVPGITDLDSSYEPGKPELRVRINRDKASDLNVSVANVATALRTLVGGDQQVTTYREGDDRYDVQLRVKKEFRDSPGAIERLFVPSMGLGNVAVSNVASIEASTGPTQIERYNRQRQIMISANLVKGQSLSNVLEIVDQTVAGLNMPPEYRSGLVGKSKEFGRSARGYVMAFLLSIVLMYMVLAAQFDSFVDPITILISLPLSVPFALTSLLIAGENFSIIYTSVGILVLFGIVKKNSILQVDHIKSLRVHEGLPRLEAILRGCEDRLRPILMTTAALVAGMLPLALGGGAGSGSRRTVAMVVIGGQSLCLLLTLLVTPVAYSYFDDIAHSRVWSRIGVWLRGLSPRRAVAGLLAVLLLGSIPAWSQPAPPRVGVGLVQRKLGLREAVEMALKSNLEIEIERAGISASAQAIKAAQGAFDPVFRWLPALESRNTPVASVLQGAGGKLAENLLTQNFALVQKLPRAGTGVQAGFDNGRSTTSNSFASLNPLTSSRLVFSITQPLLRNRAIDRERAEIKIRRKQLNLSETDFELKAIDVVSRVEQAYWDLVGARQDVGVKADGVEWAREQLARNRRMIDSGTLAATELAASEAELQRRLDAWYASLGLVTEVENLLKTLLAPDRQSPLWGEEILPTDVQPLAAPPLLELKEAVAQAIRDRAELRGLALRREVNDIQKLAAAEQGKPQVNLTASYGSSGIGGAVRTGENPISASQALTGQRLNQLSALAGLAPLPVTSFGGLPDVLIGGYGTALSNVFSGRYQSVQVGLQFDLNLRNRAAEATLEQASIAERRLKLERTRVEQAIEAQIRNSLQAIETAKQRIAAAQASERAAREKLDSEIRLFQTGESTNFLVLTRQNEYLDSRRRVVVANLDLNKAVSRLAQALGATLRSHNVTLK